MITNIFTELFFLLLLLLDFLFAISQQRIMIQINITFKDANYKSYLPLQDERNHPDFRLRLTVHTAYCT